MALTEKGQALLDFLKDNQGADMTVHDVAAGLGVAWQSVNGSMNSLVKKGLAYREEGTDEVTDAEGNTTTKAVKFLRASAEGIAYTGDEAAE